MQLYNDSIENLKIAHNWLLIVTFVKLEISPLKPVELTYTLIYIPNLEQSQILSPKSSIEGKRVVKILNARNLIRKANISINIPQSISIIDLLGS